MNVLFERLERFYDAVPRDGAQVEEYGSLVLFIRNGSPSYARPRQCEGPARFADDVPVVRARQRELGLPEAFEWMHDTTPGLLPVIEAAGLPVLHAPLLVLDPTALPPDPSDLPGSPGSGSPGSGSPGSGSPGSGARARLVDVAGPDFAADVALRRAIATVGFGSPGTAVGVGGVAERDAIAPLVSAEDLAGELRWHRSGRVVSALAPAHGEALASGLSQRVGAVVEIAGVATLPAARRRGLGAAVTAALARQAFDTGADLVFLTAGSAEIARVYERVGFRQVGTACIAEAT